eukprot:s7811_g1.t1
MPGVFPEAKKRHTKQDRRPDVDLSPRIELRRKLQCKPFRWYLKTVAKDIYVPQVEGLRAGSLKNGLLNACFDTLGGERPGLYPCHGQHGTQGLVIDGQGMIRIPLSMYARCLSRAEKGTVRLDTCTDKDEKVSPISVQDAVALCWADVICVTEYSCFVGMLTGNLIKMGSGVAKHGYADALFYISVILCNLGGVCFMRALQLHMPKRAAAIAAPVYLMLIFLSDVLTWHYGPNRQAAAFRLLGVGVAVALLVCSHSRHSKWHACLVAPAYGGQNVLGLEGTLKVSTTTTTGNFQKLSVGLFSLLTDGPATLSESQSASSKREDE